LRPSEFADALPIVALTCIDPRLNPLMPEVLGIPEEKFIWLRNAGNIIFDSMSSMTRTLALACAVKGGREIAIIGHTDCLVRKASVMELTNRFKALGIDRARLPENLNEFFGLFASERQNVLRGVEHVRSSPIIGPGVPVHGLLVEIESGRLEWLVNGYQTLGAGLSPVSFSAPVPAPSAGIQEMRRFPSRNGRPRWKRSASCPPAMESKTTGSACTNPTQPSKSGLLVCS
jgi:carbonic anhydrase